MTARREHSGRFGLKPTVLVIDDSAAAREGTTAVLEGAGYPTMTLPSAIGATRTLMRHDVSVVVADVSMPGLSGDKLVCLLRANRRLAHLGLIIVSERSEVELEVLRKTTPVDAVLSKQAIRSALIQTVEAVYARVVRDRSPFIRT